MNKNQIKNILTDIRFWIIFFFVLRLIGITNAPLEIGHNWRQSLTAMVARNFLEIDANIFYPRIDMAGEKTGILGTEFPFFNYLIYLFSLIFGYDHWYGRLINLVVSSFGLYYFYRLIKNLLSKKIAFNATIILTVSIWFAFSRKIMPDTFSVSLVIIGLYYAYDFLKSNRNPSLLLFFIFSTLGMLCKIPALSLMSVVGAVIFIREIPLRRKVMLFATSLVGLLIVMIWYFHWVPYLDKTYQFQLFWPKGFVEGINEIIPLWPETLEKFYFSSFLSFVAFGCFVAGLFFLIKNKEIRVLPGLGIITITFVVFIIKTGSVFPLHNYYIIPFTPVMALVAGYFLSLIPARFQYILLGVIAIEAIANQQHDFFIREDQKYKLKLEEVADKTIGKNDLVVINGGESPQNMYFLHRRGWRVDEEHLAKPSLLDSLNRMGAKYLIIDKWQSDQVIQNYPLMYDDKDYRVYKLKSD